MVDLGQKKVDDLFTFFYAPNSGVANYTWMVVYLIYQRAAPVSLTTCFSTNFITFLRGSE